MNSDRRRALAYCLLLLFIPCLSAQAQDHLGGSEAGVKEYTIAVLSPSEGPLREVGQLHDRSIKRAFQLSGGAARLRENGYALRFLFLSTGDPTDASKTTCVEEARSAVEEEGAIAILGPVTSGCAQRILSDSLQVPVLSSLATATDLGATDPWFFRTIAHDKRRLETFVDTARAHKIGVDHSIAIYQPSVYGTGLLNHLVDLVGSLDAAHQFEWNEAIVDTTHELVPTDMLRHALEHHGHPIENIFVLGSSDRMVSVLQALDDMFEEDGIAGDPSFVLVGSTRFANELPVGTWLIGEAQVRTSQNLITELSRKDPPGNLYMSTLDASLAVRGAIQYVLSQPGTDALDLAGVRSELQRVLDRGSFHSSERGRSIRFANGEINTPPSFPIYQVSADPHVEYVNPDRRTSWVEIRTIDEPAGHFEGPVVVELIPHGKDLSGKTVELQVEGIGDERITVREVELDSLGTRVSFVPSFFQASWFPTSFTISTDVTPEEYVEIEGLSWPVSYLLAALSALFGVLLYLRYRTKEPGGEGAGGDVKSWTAWTLAERCVAGLVIAFLIIHIGPLLEGEPVLSHIPIPEFGSSSWLNAVVAGLMGGWLGLNPIIGLVASVIGGLTPLFQSDG